jgi:hypothetical protein
MQFYLSNHKSLKIPKQRGNQKSYIEEQTTQCMAKRKSTKEQTTIDKTYI